MSDELREAGHTLREYLADRDVPCDQCGYNLRGTPHIYCPECGTVIPRPPAEHVERSRTDPAALQLWCTECDYVVTGLNAKRCPECGGTTLARFTGEKPPLRRRPWFHPRGLPGPLWLSTVFGLLVQGIALMTAVLEGMRGRGGPWKALLAFALASAPVVIAAAWMMHRPAIRRMFWGRRRVLAHLGFVGGGIGWIFALLVLRT